MVVVCDVGKNSYSMSARRVVVPEGVSEAEFLFNNPEKKDVLINTNHSGEIVLVTREGGKLSSISYADVKQGIRSKYMGKPIYVVVENVEVEVAHLGQGDVDLRTVVAVKGLQSSSAKTLFHGDTLMSNDGVQPDVSKEVYSLTFMAIDPNGRMAVVDYFSSLEECTEILERLSYGDEKIKVRGMEVLQTQSKGVVSKRIVASALDFYPKDFAWLDKVLPKVKQLDDLVVWRDLVKDTAIPNELESFMILTGLIYEREGRAPMNLCIVGAPGKGKSHLLDTFAYLFGTKSHNMSESTVKGLGYSHKSDGKDDKGGGRPGILYTERFVALLNEFMRMIVDAKGHAKEGEGERLALNRLIDALERKKDRSRSSGTTSSGVTVSCSVMTAENDFASVMGPFAKSMFSDPALIRRFSFLKLSKETEERGGSFSSVVDWRKSTEALLVKKGMSKIAWAEIMRYARSLIPQALGYVIESGSETQVREYAREKYKSTILKMVGLTEVPKDKTRSGYLESILGVSMDAFIEAMLVIAVVLRSIYDADGLVKTIVCTDEEIQLAKRCFDLFMQSYDDLFGAYLVQGFVEAERPIQRMS